MKAAAACMCMYRVGWDGGESATERMMSMIMEEENRERTKERQRKVEATYQHQRERERGGLIGWHYFSLFWLVGRQSILHGRSFLCSTLQWRWWAMKAWYGLVGDWQFLGDVHKADFLCFVLEKYFTSFLKCCFYGQEITKNVQVF